MLCLCGLSHADHDTWPDSSCAVAYHRACLIMIVMWSFVEFRVTLCHVMYVNYSCYFIKGDSLRRHTDMQFSTFDADHDRWNGNCAVAYHGAWWYNGCHASNLNGAYLRGAHTSYADGVEWFYWTGYQYSLQFTEMKITAINWRATSPCSMFVSTSKSVFPTQSLDSKSLTSSPVYFHYSNDPSIQIQYA